MKDDYTEETGRFLKSVVIGKVVNDRAQRFFSDQEPYKLESFDRAGRLETTIEPKNLPNFLAELFQISEEIISTALSRVQVPSIIEAAPTLSRERIRQQD